MRSRWPLVCLRLLINVDVRSDSCKRFKKGKEIYIGPHVNDIKL